MSIKLNAIELGQPGMSGAGDIKYYVRANADGDVTLKGLFWTMVCMSKEIRNMLKTLEFVRNN